jgi:phospholipid/cholesterol/gamma-HCH transport system substrate-binding protein
MNSYRGHLITTLVAIALAAWFFVWSLELGHGLPSSGGSYRVQALLPTAGTLAPGARVTMAGVQVGRVSSVQRDGLAALIGITLSDARVIPIRQDSQVQLRLHTAVGENYVSIVPGASGPVLRSGAVLPLSQAGDYVDVDQLLSILQGPTRQRLRGLIQGLGGALQGRGTQLNELLAGTSGTLSSGAHVVQVGYQDRAQVSRLVAQLGDLAAQVGRRGGDVATFGRQALATFHALAARDQAMRAVLDQLPATLSQVRATTDTLGSVSGRAAPVLYNLAAAVREVRPAVRMLYPASQEGRAIMRQLAPAAPVLQQTLGEVQTLAGPASAALPALGQTLCQLNPMLRYLQPYTPDVTSWITGMGSMSNNYDAVGHVLRFAPILTENSLVGLPPSISQAADTLMHSGLMAKEAGLTYDPYPAPGRVGRDSALSDPQALGPGQVPATGYRYPHVVADC